LSRREARHCRRASVIALMQLGNTAMTRMSDGAYVTDLDNHRDNSWLHSRGYTIRHIETWHRFGIDESFIVWDAPAISEADLPY
jgi:hypothetical protein